MVLSTRALFNGGILARDDFSKKNVDAIAKRAGYRCSNPECGRDTVGPSEQNSAGHDCIGVAAHISAAASGGPRFDQNLTSVERKSIDNAIHLCQVCAKLIDSNQGIDFSVAKLQKWKQSREKEARDRLRNPAYQSGEKPLLFRSEVSSLDAKEKGSQLLQLFSEKTAEHLVSQITNTQRASSQKDCPDVKRYVEGKFKAFGDCLREKNAIDLFNERDHVRKVLNDFIASKDAKKFRVDWAEIGKELCSRCYFS